MTRVDLIRARARRQDRAHGRVSFVSREEAKAIKLELISGKTVAEVATAHELPHKRVASIQLSVRANLDAKERRSVFRSRSPIRVCEWEPCARPYQVYAARPNRFCSQDCSNLDQAARRARRATELPGSQGDGQEENVAPRAGEAA